MGFVYKGSLNGGHSRTLIKVVLNAQTTFRIGDWVLGGTDDGADLPTAGVKLLGCITAIITDKGVSPSSDGLGGVFVDKYYTAASNETSGKISALIDVDPNSLYSASADSTLGATTGSNKKFYFFDLSSTCVTTGSSAQSLAETLTSATSGQFFSLGLDPDDTTRVIVKLRESAMLGDSGIA